MEPTPRQHRVPGPNRSRLFGTEFLGFIGLTDVEFVYAEGLAIGEASKNAALARAERAIERLVAPEALAA